MGNYPEKRKPSPQKRCPHCKNLVNARGWTSHLRMAHPDKASLPIELPKVSGYSKIKHRPEKTSMALEEIIIVYGITWVLNQIVKHQEQQNRS